MAKIEDPGSTGAVGAELLALRARAEAWRALDPDGRWRASIDELLAGPDEGLAEHFAHPLAFGTAGVRAPRGPGPARLNRTTVRQICGGIVAHLERLLGRPPIMVVGRDARHDAASFADDAAGVIANRGGRALLATDPLPTPVLAHAIGAWSADGAIVITASHNPPSDSGIKVYLGDGAQIVAPHDTEIADEVTAIGDELPAIEPTGLGVVETIDPVPGYLDGLGELVAEPATASPGIQIVYSALHGVGAAVTRDAFAQAGFGPLLMVESQAGPDPDFPSVAFPNPEEPGAMDAAIALAVERNADLVLVHDGDADRLGAAISARPEDRRAADGWRVLTGDEIGVLLADHLLARGGGADRLVVSTVASSRLLGRIAEASGVTHLAVLTGTKWIARAALDRPELNFVFGYEEALGYMIGRRIRDKDGITAALALTQAATAARAAGTDLAGRLDDIARAHGVYETDQWSLRFDPGPTGLAAIAAITKRLRTDPPEHIGGVAVQTTTDLANGGPLPPSDVLILDLIDGSRVVVRPSGTEPKAKFYLETSVPVDGDLGAARAESARRLDGLRSGLALLVEPIAGSARH